MRKWAGGRASIVARGSTWPHHQFPRSGSLTKECQHRMGDRTSLTNWWMGGWLSAHIPLELILNIWFTFIKSAVFPSKKRRSTSRSSKLNQRGSNHHGTNFAWDTHNFLRISGLYRIAHRTGSARSSRMVGNWPAGRRVERESGKSTKKGRRTALTSRFVALCT